MRKEVVALFKFNWRRNRRPIAVVLGAGIQNDGTPSYSTLLRAKAAADLAAANPNMKFIILSGRGPDARNRPVTEAEMMSNVLATEGIDRSRLLLEDESIDTIGNAVLVAARYLHEVPPRNLYLITSPFHMERSLLIFRHVLGPKWHVEPHTASPSWDDGSRAATEPGGIEWARRFFSGIKPGDLCAIIAKLQAEKPYYATLDWLDACSYPSRSGRLYRLRCRATKWLKARSLKHCCL